VPLISIIIPVYNTEKYLRKCLDSVCAQTLRNIEIIIVNDGSKDGSLLVIEEYLTKDQRIKLINQKNAGQASARNAGLEIAEGFYVGFVDSDDSIESNMFEELYSAAIRENADVAICNFNIVFEDETKKNIKSLFNIKNHLIKMDEIGVENYIRQYIRGFKHGNEVYTRLYKNELLKENAILFEKNTNNAVPEIAEDMLFNLKCSLSIKKIVEVEVSPYNYLVRPGSSITSAKPDLILRFIKLVEKFENYSADKIEKIKLKKIVIMLMHSIIKEEIMRFLKDGKKIEIINDISSCYDNQYLNKTLLKNLKVNWTKLSLNDLDREIFIWAIRHKHIEIYVRLVHFHMKFKTIINL